MGLIQSFFKKLFADQQVRLVMIGLDAAGKTTILGQLKFAECQTTIPTVGFNLESINYKKMEMDIWDIGGQQKIRKLWRHYYTNVQGVIFVVDSTDETRFEEVKEELSALNNEEELSKVPILVFANKQDHSKALKPKEISEKLELSKIYRGRSWYLQGCSAKTKDGLYEGLDWLAETLKK